MAQTHVLSAISPESIIAAALITQVSVLAIVFLGALSLRLSEVPGYLPVDQPRSNQIFVFTLGVAVFSVAILCLSNAYSEMWLPAMKLMSFSGIPWERSILTVWITDLILLGFLVRHTGGGLSSPFTSLFFVFPTIALFLHESGHRIFLYTGLSIVLFTMTLVSNEEDSNSTHRFCFWLVSVSCFVLTTAVGFVTRP